jgi:hypothetical protein
LAVKTCLRTPIAVSRVLCAVATPIMVIVWCSRVPRNKFPLRHGAMVRTNTIPIVAIAQCARVVFASLNAEWGVVFARPNASGR